MNNFLPPNIIVVEIYKFKNKWVGIKYREQKKRLGQEDQILGSKTKKVRLLYPTAKKKKLPGSNLGELIARLALK
jgi:hypothetical protein